MSDPLELQDFADSDQQIASWALQSLRSHDLDHTLTLFTVPVLARSHWFPIGLQVQQGTATMMMPVEVANTVQQLVIDACGPHELGFSAFVLPTEFAADCGFQTVNWFFARATGNESPKAVTPAQADQWRVPFALQCLRRDHALHPDQLLLQSVLKQHGVAQERIAGLCNKPHQQARTGGHCESARQLPALERLEDTCYPGLSTDPYRPGLRD